MWIVTVLVAAAAASYLLDRAGAAISPFLVLAFAVATATALLHLCFTREPRSIDTRRDLLGCGAVGVAVLAALLWRAWPDLLPLGGGSDLTHHLQLIDFIDRYRRLAHGTVDAVLVGNMVNYTPGSHLLASLAGVWARTDGLHAVYPLLAFTVALKAGLVFAIVRRATGMRAVAVACVALLFLPLDYFIGSFTEFSFVAQVVAELFAVAMWLALVLWDRDPSRGPAVLFAIGGIGVFLTWPVWIGPPVAVLGILALLKTDVAVATRLRLVALALLPIAVVGALHAVGRGESVAIVQSGGAAFWPTVARFTWPFLLLTAAGLVLALRQRESRVTVLFFAATAAQAIALFLLARRGGADSPYMALKMPHLAIYPMAVLGGVALQRAWHAVERALLSVGPPRPSLQTRLRGAAWIPALVCAAWAISRFAAAPRQSPAITEDLYRAGLWARGHAQTDCVEYLVRQDSTSYWLHQAVLGNTMQPRPGTPPPVFFYREALVRWITRTSFPVAIADVALVPREVREDLDVLAQYGDVVVGRRKGSTECPGR